ncbi:hypothetical protein BN10_520083 [Phycicoccus elongatus Lp2]|uniref:Uncharacterized protein n=1 Tax=Phycicoccus elongatus Lp2 TaxID=1193181 RepID=N0E031_9MICO|nr:hypothetical protein BN10_520083 [Phycicoccus elongatus Lp2]
MPPRRWRHTARCSGRDPSPSAPSSSTRGTGTTFRAMAATTTAASPMSSSGSWRMPRSTPAITCGPSSTRTGRRSTTPSSNTSWSACPRSCRQAPRSSCATCERRWRRCRSVHGRRSRTAFLIGSLSWSGWRAPSGGVPEPIPRRDPVRVEVTALLVSESTQRSLSTKGSIL